MRILVVGLLMVVAFVLAGCSDPDPKPGPPSSSSTIPSTEACPSDALRRQVYADSEAYFEDRLLVDVPGTVRLEGTLEGEVGTFIVAVDPAKKAMRVSGPGLEVRVAEPYYSMEMEDGDDVLAAYGRDHRPGATYDEFMDQFAGEDAPSFTDDLTVDDYVATCKEQGGVEVIEYRYESGGRRSVNVAERTGSHRPLSGEEVDPALQDNFRASVSYDVPAITVDASLERRPLTWAFDVVDSGENDRGGIHLSGTLAEETEWAPFTELEVHLIDQGDGSVYFEETLASKTYDMGDGDLFTFTDKDSNGKLSAGDTFVMDVGQGLDIYLYDTWAEAYTMSVTP